MPDGLVFIPSEILQFHSDTGCIREKDIVSLVAPNSAGKAVFKKLSVTALIMANAAPIFGILFMGWQVFPVLFLFWMENVIIGASNVLKMAICSPGDQRQLTAKIFFIPFFCVHYGIFTLVHGVFVIFLFGMVGGFIKPGEFASGPFDIAGIISKLQLGWSILALAVSHAVSLVINYVGNGEYKQNNVVGLMLQPYGRVVIMHITVLFGGFLVLIFGSPVVGLILLVVLKIVVDTWAHLRQHRLAGKSKSEKAEIASA